MNKALFEKVKKLCKDNGLSEKYLQSLTEKMGGSIEDDSTDESAIEEMANQIAGVAAISQGEATRWANRKKDNDAKPKNKQNQETDDEDDPEDKAKPKSKEKSDFEALKELIEKQNAKIEEFQSSLSAKSRESAIKEAQKKHDIPDWRMKGLVIPEDQDVDEFLSDIKQDLITEGLVTGDSTGAKTVSDKHVDEAADSLLESITVTKE